MFEYDFWANQQWIEPARNIGAESVLAHIVSAQEVWLSRCKGTIEARPEEDLAHRLKLIHRAWMDYLSRTPLDTQISYSNFRGEAFTDSLENIATHVYNHGTFHRGDLRGRCAALGSDAFPETDYIGYVRFLQRA